MAGNGSRFKKNGEMMPKPLIDVDGLTMIEQAVKTLGLDGHFIFITRIYDDPQLNDQINTTLKNISPDCTIIPIDYLTEGAASTAFLAKEFINNDEELVVANCDQILRWDSDKFLEFRERECDGIVVTYNANTEKNSYIRVDENGFGVELAEKKVISNLSLNGVHYWKSGKDFVRSYQAMYKHNDTANGEYYMSITYNYLIKEGKKILPYNIPIDEIFCIGTPEDLEKYLKECNDY
jgi:NDP-sugar pyrophosphorylase family protein